MDSAREPPMSRADTRRSGSGWGASWCSPPPPTRGRTAPRRTAVTPGRRTLRYESFDEVMTDVERLLEGHRTVGNWSLDRIYHHLAAVLRRHVDLPASTVFDPA